MKKRHLALFCVLIFTIALSAAAAYGTGYGESQPGGARQSLDWEALGDTVSMLPAGTDTEAAVMDTAGLLSEAQAAELNERAEHLTDEYECAVLIVTVSDLAGMDVEMFAEELHRNYFLGYGDEQSCIMLLLSMEYRDYDLMAYGYGNTAFTDWGKSVMEDGFLPYFGENDYYGGFVSYLDSCERYLQMARAGTPFDIDTDDERIAEEKQTRTALGLGAGLAAALAIAFLVCQIFKSQMKTAKEKDTAENYISDRGLSLTGKTDMFINTTRTQTLVNVDNHNSGGGGGTSINSGGFSHSSGKF